MEDLGDGSPHTSPASSPRSLDARRLSTRVDSAYSSFSADSGGPEPCPGSPGPLLPGLTGDYARVVASDPPASPEPQPAAAACSGQGPSRVQGGPEPLSRLATPLLFALAAEVAAAARAAEPPSPPASRAAYRLRLQGAQRRVLRATSFQRKELRLGPRAPAASPRSASLSGDPEPRCHPSMPGPTGRGRLNNPPRKWCFSEPEPELQPGELGPLQKGGRAAAQGDSRMLARREPQLLQSREAAEFEGPKIRKPPENPRGLKAPEPATWKLSPAYRPSSGHRRASGEFTGPFGDAGGTMPSVQTTPQDAETSRPVLHARLPRFLAQMESAVGYPAEGPQSRPADCVKRISEASFGSAGCPSHPDDEVFLEEAPLVRRRSAADSHVPQKLPASIHAFDQLPGVSLDQRTDQAPVSPESSFSKCWETLSACDCWQEASHPVATKPTCCSPSQTANGDNPPTGHTGLLNTGLSTTAECDSFKSLPADALGIQGSGISGLPNHTAPAWCMTQPGSSARLEELIKELARLDPSLSDTLTSYPSPPSIPLALLDGLIPLAEVWAAMKSAGGEAGEDPAAAATSETGSCPFSSTLFLSTSQEETRLVPNQACGQSFPGPKHLIQAKKEELAELLREVLLDLEAERKQLQRVSEAWALRRAALEAVIGQACAPRELERFSRFLTDLERVLGLLLLLGSRLSRVHRALSRLGADCDPEEQASLQQRLGLLQRQQEDARELREHVARRERALREVLARALPAQELCAYRALLAGKAAILAQQRSLDERTRLLQDQLDAVRSDLGQSPLVPRAPP